jgi:hypothetical protein
MGLRKFSFGRITNADVIELIYPDATAILVCNKGTANVLKLQGGLSVSGDDLIIYANQTDAQPYLSLLGNGNAELTAVAEIMFNNASTRMFGMSIDGTDSKLITVANNNLLLNPSGTGKVKFGTHTALGGEALSGYISILDAAGNARKLGVIS